MRHETCHTCKKRIVGAGVYVGGQWYCKETGTCEPKAQNRKRVTQMPKGGLTGKWGKQAAPHVP